MNDSATMQEPSSPAAEPPVADAEAADEGRSATPDAAALPSDAEIARAMRLRPDPPRVVRLSRKALLAASGAGALALAGALFYALRPDEARPPAELINTQNQQPTEALQRLPQDYSKVPQLGPPLPGDLGGPMLAAGIAPDGASPEDAPEAPPRPDLRQQAIEHRRQQLAQERDAARTSGLFTSTSERQNLANGVDDQAPVILPASTVPSGSDREAARPGRPTDYPRQEANKVRAPSSAYLLQAGAVIPAALITGIRSDLPGQITAQVTENVYDSVTGRTLLIPQGARLIGHYDAETDFGQRRALLLWTRLILPDGRSLALDGLPGADAQGFAGLEDRVDNHWGQIFQAALISTLLSMGAEAGTSGEEDALVRALRRGSSDAISQAGRQVIGRSLEVEPTLTIRPGHSLRVIVTRDLAFEPWTG